MEKQANLVLNILFFFVLLLGLLQGHLAKAEGTDDGSEQWGYVEVRPKAHMFWWLYKSPYRVEDKCKPWPTILWLQGGPGASGAGLGNFLEIGPLDVNLNPRNYTWLKKADILFVDNPVGTGFSYVEDGSLLVKTDAEAATDLTTLLKQVFNGNETLQKSPLYIFAESYGGRYAVTVALSAINAIKSGTLKLNLEGVALGNSWISPEDIAASWAPLLKDVSRMDENGLAISAKLVLKIHKLLANGAFQNATDAIGDLEEAISDHSNGVDWYNFLLDYNNDPVNPGIVPATTLMNGPIKEKLKIIPKNLTWVGINKAVFTALEPDQTVPRIKEVDELLAKGVNVTIYNGNVDLICSTKGVEAWVNKLKWNGLKTWKSMNRTALYCGSDNTTTKAFFRAYKNFSFYWILGSGHFVPVYQPCAALDMVGNVTRSPNSISHHIVA